MFLKGTLAAGLMAVSLAFSPVAAEAKTRVHVGIGMGWAGGCFGQFRRHCNFDRRHRRFVNIYPYYAYPYYDPYFRRYPRVYYRNSYLSCGAARAMLRDRGYHRISARDCTGATYVFRAVKRGHVYRVKVSARSGAVVSLIRI